MEFDVVIGLEVHVQLNTKSKIFCSCSTEFGGKANSQICPVCMGLPGALPVLNREALNKAIIAGLVLNCDIQLYSQFDRKHYFYPDLPKSYQTSQMYYPICLGGHINITKANQESKKINITRIHLEEDAGKLVHGDSKASNVFSFVDLNRSSMPLIEIVSEPEISSPEEAQLYMQKLKTLLSYANVSDCNMEEGSLRCDANVSIKPKGANKLGTRTEIKNMNSFKNVYKAIEYEIERQKDEVLSGNKIIQETRLWDSSAGITVSMRAKEDAGGYRYFPCPDSLPVIVSQDQINKLRDELPELPDQKKKRFLDEYALSEYDASVITDDKDIAEYFEKAIIHHHSPKLIANWMLSELLRIVNEKNVPINQTGILPTDIAELVKLIEEGKISGKQGKEVFLIAAQENIPLLKVIEDRNIKQESNEEILEALVKEVINSNPEELARFKNGDKKLLGFFMGQVMKVSSGKANPKKVNEIILKLLS